MSDRLTPGGALSAGAQLTSNNGTHRLVMQGDGNLVLYRASGAARWATGTNGQTVAQCRLQPDGNLVLLDAGQHQLWESHSAGHPGATLVMQDDGNLVIYSPTGQALWATGTNITTARVAGFVPSKNGFHFSNNNFPRAPDLQISVPGLPSIALGDASNGLCGGMAYAARDLFEARRLPPAMTTTPGAGPLFDFLVQRLFTSFDIPGGVLNYLHLMNPDLPDHETWATQAGMAPHGRSWVMIKDQWPKIRADIDSGHPSPMALIQAKTHDPFQLGRNHQVLAWGYEIDVHNVRILIYDPNFPNRDDDAIEFSDADPLHTTIARHVLDPRELYCFFRTNYTFAPPPADLVTVPAKKQITVRNVTSHDQEVKVFNPGDLVMLIPLSNGTFKLGPSSVSTFIFQDGLNQVRLTANGRPLGLANPGDAVVIQQDDTVLVRNVSGAPIHARIYKANDGLMWATLPGGDLTVPAMSSVRYTVPPDLKNVKVVINGRSFPAGLGGVVVFS